IAPLPGPGVVVGDALLASDKEIVSGFVAATLPPAPESAPEPQTGMDAAVVAVPAIAEDRETALGVLEATIELWKAGAPAPSGAIDDAVWTSGCQTMRDLGFIERAVPPDEMVEHLLKETSARFAVTIG